jgi:hypothetical protein
LETSEKKKEHLIKELLDKKRTKCEHNN